MAKKNQIIESLLIEDLAEKGRGVGRVNGKVVFVPKAIPGDIIDVRVYKKRRSYLEAKKIKTHQASSNRTEPFCDHANICGGCPIQSLDYEKQLIYKHKLVEDAFKRIAKEEDLKIYPIIPSVRTKHYRNKLEFTFSEFAWIPEEDMDNENRLEIKNVLGFHVPGRFDKVLNIDTCYLQVDIHNKIRNRLAEYAREKNYSFYNIRANTGFLRNLIIRTSTIGEIMLLLSVAQSKKDDIDDIMNFLKSEFPELTSLNYVINEKMNDSIHDLEVKHFSGKPFIVEQLGSLRFNIRPKSFFQTNSTQAINLYDIVKDFAAIDDKSVVFDLYTGTGTIANYVASEANKVIGIEVIKEAIEDAKDNSALNEIDNTSFYVGDVKDKFVSEIFNSEGRPDIVITNPARAGMHGDVIKTLLSIAPDRIVYVSCNPSTQARDVALLSEKYDIIKMQPVDMFPHTMHVENVVLLKKQETV